MKRLVVMGTFSVLLALFVGGCNIWSFTAPSESSADYVHEGRSALQDGDYATAIEKFQAALDQDPNNAYARWGIAKAYIRQSGFTTIGIMDELSSFQAGPAGTKLPFMTTSIDSANALYQGVIHANKNLMAISSGEATNEELNPSSIALDQTGCLLLQGILLFRDTDGNDTINSADFNLQAILDAANNFSFADTSLWNSMSPEEQQAMYNNIDSLLTNSGAALDTFLAALDTSLTSGFNTGNLDSVISNIQGGFSDFYNGGGGKTGGYYGGTNDLRRFTQGRVR